MLAGIYEKEFEGWEEKLKNDEWYFCNLRETLVNDLTPEIAFNEIEHVVELTLETDEELISMECFELLLSLVRKTETTEVSKSINENWQNLRKHMSKYGEYQKKKFSELSNWYRKSTL